MTGDDDQSDSIDLGVEPFATTHARMLETARAVRRDGPGAGRIFLVEHPSVFTAGRATPREELTAGVVPIERGGRVTWHGPGQLVVYPIIHLPERDVRAWLRRVEAFGVGVCATFGLHAEPSVDGTGVFVGGAKVASIGVAIRHWINLHGIAINVDVDLRAFHEISPCGLDPAIMTDLSRLVRRRVSLAEARLAARENLFLLRNVAESL